MYHDLLPPPERWNDAYTYEDHAEESPSPPRTAKRRRIRAETSSKEADKDKDSQTLLTVEEYVGCMRGLKTSRLVETDDCFNLSD
jgi:hypothetical protein